MENQKTQPMHNLHQENPKQFGRMDAQLSRLKSMAYIYQSPLLQELPRKIPGIYTLGGGRQVGKSTLVKQWILQLLREGVNPKKITYLTGELIMDHKVLVSELQNILDPSSESLSYLIIDEVNYIEHWAKGIKYLADLAFFDNTILLLTGSDLTMLQDAVMTFPGRRGKADVTDFHLHPLSFKEFVLLDKKVDIDSVGDELLESKFNEYLIHGGYLTAINDLALNGKVSKSTLTTYSEWIRGDILRRGKQEVYLREVLSAIVKRYGTQLSWQALSRGLSIDHHKTIADYCELLEKMDAFTILKALMEDRLVGAPKKQKKLFVKDPFIFHAINAWLNPGSAPELLIKKTLQDPECLGSLVEGVVVEHFNRHYPTYYIKAEGEVDVAYVDQGRFWPIEVKWTEQLRPKDLKQISKYKNARIFSKLKKVKDFQEIPASYLPRALLTLF